MADIPGLQFNGHELGAGELIRRPACQLGYGGVVSKAADAPYAPDDRRRGRKAKCLSRQEFVVVGWTDPEDSLSGSAGSLPEFNFQAGVRLNVVNNIVIAVHQIGHRNPPAVGGELVKFVQVERDKLLNLENVDPVAQAGIVRQAFSNGQTALTRHQDGANAIVDVVPAAFDHGFARRRGDMDRHIPDQEIAAPARLLIRCRIAVVLKIALTKRAIELRPDHVLHHRAGVVDAWHCFLTVFSLAQHVADDRAQAARGVQADFKGFGGEKLVNALNPDPSIASSSAAPFA